MEVSVKQQFGRYRLIRKIATGGMAEIWLAIQLGPHGFEKTAVLKVILPELGHNDDFVHMFLDEARLAASLDHNNVARIYDFGQINGKYYIAMEYLPGEDLASLIQAHKRAGRHMPLEAACELVLGAAIGLHFAHELTDNEGRPLNVVHRDVSPSNIIVTYQGTVKLVDFGIARAETNITKTAVGTLKGKVAYVSPEQASGLPIDRRSDIFSLGTVLYELLTLRRPFKRDHELATLQAVLNDPIPSPRSIRADIPEALEKIVVTAMDRDLNKRFQTAAAMADEVGRFLVSLQYVRSERALADYLSLMFDAERRLGKLRVSRAVDVDTNVSQRTPSILKNLELSPVRSQTRLAASSPQLSEAAQETRSLVNQPDLALTQLTDVELRPEELGSSRSQASTSFERALPMAPAPALAPAPPAQKGKGKVAAIAGLFLVATVTFGVGVGFLKHRRTEQNKALAEAAPALKVPAVAEAQPKPKPIPAPEPVPDPIPVDPAPAPEPVVSALAPKKPLKPKAATGKLSLQISPWCEVFLKGKKLGDTPLIDYPLPAGVHFLTLVNEKANVNQVIQVEVLEGETTVKKLKL